LGVMRLQQNKGKIDLLSLEFLFSSPSKV